MNWLYKTFGISGGRGEWAAQQYSPGASMPSFNIYQCPEKPWVFLGQGEDSTDFEIATAQFERTFGNPPTCILRFQVTGETLDPKLPPAVAVEPLPDPNTQVWSDAEYSEVQSRFNERAEQIANTIEHNQSCLIFVHCAAGVNRSPAILAAALSRITGKSIFEILRGMKEQRTLVSPTDAYIMMALEFSNHPDDQRQVQSARQEMYVPETETLPNDELETVAT